eukprot:comp21551_c2_seq1/m.30053 comp21551_c2_seq1/g.30053  ORF comp21551_c2_seq1/g.30053 comp21551_c2_seq1/m.30053 type:complete len:122 (-) comp21551_c2_seq1:397-762(-)
MPDFGETSLGNPPFCLTCGTILPLPGVSDVVECKCCGHREPISGFIGKEHTQKNRPNAFASVNRAKAAARVKEKAATINEQCPECGHREMSFHTMQLRSADEGQTVFYTCLKCGYNFSVNS